MKRAFILFALVLPGLGSLRAAPALSVERLNSYDQQGYFTPKFKDAIHEYVDAQEALKKAQVEQKKFEHDLPALQQQAAEAQAKAVALRQELAKYDHPEEDDFQALQGRTGNEANSGETMALAQAYIWTYPTSPHAVEAQQLLASLQKKAADQVQAEKDSVAAREAAHAKLIQRAQAHDLTTAEWRDLLRGMSQDDLVRLFGQPSSKHNDYWFYEGAWTENPELGKKVGLQINFDAGRVLTVDPKPAAP